MEDCLQKTKFSELSGEVKKSVNVSGITEVFQKSHDKATLRIADQIRQIVLDQQIKLLGAQEKYITDFMDALGITLEELVRDFVFEEQVDPYLPNLGYDYNIDTNSYSYTSFFRLRPKTLEEKAIEQAQQERAGSSPTDPEGEGDQVHRRPSRGPRKPDPSGRYPWNFGEQRISR